MYDAIWQGLIELVPQLRENVMSIMSDLERAQINSAKTNFPRARVTGCIFHYKQVSVSKKLIVEVDLLMTLVHINAISYNCHFIYY